MHTPTLKRRRPIPIADRLRDGTLVESEHPRVAAIRFLRERLADKHAGLDPYDPAILVLIARPHERVWAYRALELCGAVLTSTDTESGGRRLHAVLEADVRNELLLDAPEPPLMSDVPLASRSVDQVMEAVLEVLPRPTLTVLDGEIR